jgi:predicted DNA-binding transcriptional regulator AlpA
MTEKETVAAPPDDRLIGSDELCRKLNLGRVSLWRKIRQGRIPPPVSLGGRRNFWRLSEIDELLRTLPVAAAYAGIGSALAAKGE